MLAARRARVTVGAFVALSGLLAVAASRPGSPFTPPLYPGGEAPAWLQAPARWLGLDRLPREVIAAVGGVLVFGLVIAFLFVLRAAWRGEISVRTVVIVTILLHVLAVAMPLFLSRDVYSYSIYGRMVSAHGANPYVQVPAAFTADPAYPLVSVDWIDSRSVYGPAFSAIAAGITAIVSSPAAMVLAFKLLAAIAGLATTALVWAAARRVIPARAAFAAILVGWNPVVVFHGVAGAHNDALLGLAIAGGVLALLARRDLVATGLLTLATLVKVSGGVPLFMAVAGRVARRPPGARLGVVARHVAVAVLVSLPFVIPFMQTEDPTLGTLELATRQGWLAPSRFLLVALRAAGRAVGGEVAGDVATLAVRVAFPLLFAWVVLVLVRHLLRDGRRIEPPLVVAAMGWAGLVSLLVSPVLLPWYAAWVMPLAWILPRPARGGAVLLSMALAATELVAEPSRSPGVYEAVAFGLHWVATPIVLLVLVRLVLELRRRARAGPAIGMADPLLADELVVASALPAEGEEVPGHDEDGHDGQRAGAAGKHADAVGGHRPDDRHTDPG